MQSQIELVREVRAKYGPLMTDEQCGLLTYEVAYRLAQTDPAWGVSAKPNGKASTLPNGQRIAHDILHYRTTNTLIDILQAAGAESLPQWAEVPYHGDPAGRPWLPAVDAAMFRQAQPPTAPWSLPPAQIPAGPTITDVLLRLDTLTQAIDVIASRLSVLDALTDIQHQTVQTQATVARLDDSLKAGVPVTLQAKLIGRVTGTVGGPIR